MTTRTQIVISAAIVAVAAALLVAFTLTSSGDEAADGEAAGHDHAAMMAAVGDEQHPVRLAPEAARRIGLTYADVASGPLHRAVRVMGVVVYDETRLVDVSPRLEGWIEELYVDFTGAPVRHGEPLLTLFSPTLVAAQEELILARRLVDDLGERGGVANRDAGVAHGASNGSGGGRAAENARELLEAARRRLAYWGIGPDQIAAVEESGVPEQALVIRAPADGLVVEKNVVRGTRVEPGTSLYRIADLSRVWVEGEVFEKDLGLVEIGQKVAVGLAAYPGQDFTGTVTYIHPTFSAESRTGRIRVELSNPELRLKPGMYASLSFEAPIHMDGLHIPRSAVLVTGSRAVVFVRAADDALVTREVTVGRSSGSEIEVLAGLEAGEVVVSSANFLIDAEANLGMAMEGMEEMDMDGEAGGHDAHGTH